MLLFTWSANFIIGLVNQYKVRLIKLSVYIHTYNPDMYDRDATFYSLAELYHKLVLIYQITNAEIYNWHRPEITIDRTECCQSHCESLKVSQISLMSAWLQDASIKKEFF